MIDAAAATGGKADPGSKQDRNGMVYGRSFQDPAGHHWEPMRMDRAPPSRAHPRWKMPEPNTKQGDGK